MEAPFVPADRAETHALVKECYEKGTSTSFLKALKLSAEDPIEPIDRNGKYRLHPLLWTAVLALIGGIGIILYFTFKS